MKLLKTLPRVSNIRQHAEEQHPHGIHRPHLAKLPSEVQDTMAWAQEQTARNTGTTLTLTLNYGSRSEIVDAARTLVHKMIAEAHQRGISVEDMLAAEGVDDAIKHRIDEPPDFFRALYRTHALTRTSSFRTSGEQRISGFLLWQIAYAEIFVTDRLLAGFPRPASARSHSPTFSTASSALRTSAKPPTKDLADTLYLPNSPGAELERLNRH